MSLIFCPLAKNSYLDFLEKPQYMDWALIVK